MKHNIAAQSGKSILLTRAQFWTTPKNEIRKCIKNRDYLRYKFGDGETYLGGFECIRLIFITAERFTIEIGGQAFMHGSFVIGDPHVHRLADIGN